MGEPEPVAPDRDPIEPDEQAIALRALDFSTLPNAGTDAENWERARLELREERQMTVERAAQIAQARGSGTRLVTGFSLSASWTSTSEGDVGTAKAGVLGGQPKGQSD